MTSDTPAAQPRPFNVGLTFSHDLYDGPVVRGS